MFSKGQCDAMNETLEGVYDAQTNATDIGYREYMWSAENLDLTGTADGFIPEFCASKADFSTTSGISSICEGEQIMLKGNKMSKDVDAVIRDLHAMRGKDNSVLNLRKSREI